MTSRGGLFSHLAELLGAKLAYLRARLQLAGIESREALVHYAIILGLAVGALVIALFGYLLFVIGIVFLIAWLLGGGNAWIWVMLAAAATHLIGTATLLLVAKIKLSQPMFEATLAEFKKDQQWLKTPAKPN